MTLHRRVSTFLLAALLLISCAAFAPAQTVSKATFGKTSDGQNIDLYTLRNTHGVEATITNYGGIVVSLKIPGRNGKFDDVVLGFNDLDTYLTSNGPYLGALIGRYGNRIAKG